MALSFIERPEVAAALGASGYGVAVVTGPPGAGKSTAVRHAELGHVVWVALAEAATTAVLLQRVASALGVTEDASVEIVGRALQGLGEITVVLDDVDRLVGQLEPIIERWHREAPDVRFVATSRERLDLPGAAVVEVGPMTLEQAVALFADRAARARPSFAIDDHLEPVVRQLVDELDCMPLAIELAAARANALGPAEILARLPQRFRVLRDRGQTLQAALDVSWELLDESERDTMIQCTMFAGGFDARAAEAVVVLDDDGPWVVDVLQSLVDKSLLRSLAPATLTGEVRFELLTSIREFVRTQAEPDPAARRRHAEYFQTMSRALTADMRRAGGAVARARLTLDQQNLLAAFEHAVALSEPVLAVDLALTLHKVFRLRGPHDTWQDVLERAAAMAPDDARAAWVRRALGELHLLRGEFEQATAQLQHAATAAERAAEHVTLAWTEFLRGEVERRRGRPGDAEAFLDRALATSAQHEIPHVRRMALGHLAGCLVDIGKTDDARNAIDAIASTHPSEDLRDEATLLKRLAYAQHYLGNTDEQVRLTQRALELAREGGDHRLEALCIQGLGDAAFVRADYESAREAWRDALKLHRAHGSAELEGALLGNLGNLEHRLGRLDAAREAYSTALEMHARTGARPYEAVVRFALGVLELEQGHLEAAERSLAKAAAINQEIGNVADEGSCNLVRAWVAEVRGGSGAPLRAAAAASFEASGDADWVVLCEGGSDAVTDPTVRDCRRALMGESVSDLSRLHVRAAIAARRAPVVTPAGDTVRVARDASWFEVGGERVGLGRRRAPRYILRRLVELCVDAPGVAIDVDEAFAVGWPDEVATVTAANDRVYWAIRTLRKLGLEEYLLTSGDGYLLDPDATTVC